MTTHRYKPALRPFNTKYQERAWWVHLDDGSGSPLCGRIYRGHNTLIPESTDENNPHVCASCKLTLDTAPETVL